MPRILNKKIENSETEVVVLDDPGEGGACHIYQVYPMTAGDHTSSELTTIEFQNGPVRENGVNGCQNEDLIAIVIDRLEGFQKGPLPCAANGQALSKLNDALYLLNSRTLDRQQRGVEGQNVS